MKSLTEILGPLVGMSDHSQGSEVCLAAVAMGAKVIEKHLTLDRTMSGPDHAASMEPDDFTVLVRQIRLVESALGDGIKLPAQSEIDTAQVIRKSLISARDLPEGHVLGPADVAIKRPGDGIAPGNLEQVIGRRLLKSVSADMPLHWDDLA
jgi:sialic acid synthase SpsE